MPPVEGGGEDGHPWSLVRTLRGVGRGMMNGGYRPGNRRGRVDGAEGVSGLRGGGWGEKGPGEAHRPPVVRLLSKPTLNEDKISNHSL